MAFFTRLFLSLGYASFIAMGLAVTALGLAGIEDEIATHRAPAPQKPLPPIEGNVNMGFSAQPQP